MGKETYCITDIHGNFKALKQCLERSRFNYKKDRLIVLGDTCDGWLYVRDCFNELLKVKDLVYVLGNHDLWALNWYTRQDPYHDNIPELLWFQQGGENTLRSYDYKYMDADHINLLRECHPYYIQDNMVFVHGGFEETCDIVEQPLQGLIWDRYLFGRAVMVHGCNPDYRIQDWDTVFVGHTTVQCYWKKWYEKSCKYVSYDTDECTQPVFVCNLINLDTGGGWDGKLTIMNIHSKEYWQSDLAKTLYPGEIGRR